MKKWLLLLVFAAQAQAQTVEVETEREVVSFTVEGLQGGEVAVNAIGNEAYARFTGMVGNSFDLLVTSNRPITFAEVSLAVSYDWPEPGILSGGIPISLSRLDYDLTIDREMFKETNTGHLAVLTYSSEPMLTSFHISGDFSFLGGFRLLPSLDPDCASLDCMTLARPTARITGLQVALTVPEPATWALLAAGLIPLVRRLT